MTEPLATVTCYRDLHAAWRRRADVVRISREQLDKICGFPDGYTAQLLAAEPRKRASLDAALVLTGALGMAAALNEDAGAMFRIAEMVGSRREERVSASREASERKRLRRLVKKLSRMGNLARSQKTTPEQRSRSASKAARTRWGRRRRTATCAAAR